jgi:DNA sulfur modification protein DndD
MPKKILYTKLLGDVRVLDTDIIRAKKKIDILQTEHSEKIEKNKKVAGLEMKANFCKSAVELLTKVQREMINEVRKIVESRTQKYFLDMIWKKGTFTGVSIDEKYRIMVSHIDGFNATGSLSAGETLYLALSFIAALREISGFKFPIVIDTPLGRVSGKPRILAAENLPKYLPGTQITMLVTDTEYASPVIDEDTNDEIGSFRDRILPYVGREYKLTYNESERDADVIEYDAPRSWT